MRSRVNGSGKVGKDSRAWTFPNKVTKSRCVKGIHQSEIYSLGNGVGENAIEVISDVPHGEAEHMIVNDELPLGDVRGGVIVGGHQFLGLVVSVWLLARQRELRNQDGVDFKLAKLTVWLQLSYK